jgi:hypothetical protein
LEGATGQTTEDYEEKLREVEEVCGPIIKHVWWQRWGHGAGWACDARLAYSEKKMDKREMVNGGLFLA